MVICLTIDLFDNLINNNFSIYSEFFSLFYTWNDDVSSSYAEHP